MALLFPMMNAHTHTLTAAIWPGSFLLLFPGPGLLQSSVDNLSPPRVFYFCGCCRCLLCRLSVFPLSLLRIIIANRLLWRVNECRWKSSGSSSNNVSSSAPVSSSRPRPINHHLAIKERERERNRWHRAKRRKKERLLELHSLPRLAFSSSSSSSVIVLTFLSGAWALLGCSSFEEEQQQFLLITGAF